MKNILPIILIFAGAIIFSIATSMKSKGALSESAASIWSALGGAVIGVGAGLAMLKART